ncbi:uncharacterized protein LOC129609851 [Condylostylus longicornis]|uniref:uncharacterized protein LOC129609851 n=1 Tax=Condylostylus longicornis TaxID=2530218 RepID=UPI00244E45C3|nr:uncharacterized protein LOC129609851 [Condylostylus longicornis]XP_055377972.1 uncharacterized protein LOC129609851 [Condylostylus longicornis]XP_055377980.1 uncharacterized protein LOC129609851 [Condylostylus longicornis]
MSCQQAPRITEDPYTFTDTAPTTATLFNPQIHKLTPIIQNANVRQFLPKKTQIFNQHPRIFNTTSSNVKTQKAVSVVGRLNGIPVSITSNSNVVNGLHKISSTNPPLSSIGFIKSQNISQTSQPNSNSLIISKTSIASPVAKFQGQPAQFQQQSQNNPQTQTVPQIVSLHQSHPLYSVARQTQIVTTSAIQGNVTSQTSQTIQQQKQSLNPPQNIKQKSAFSLSNNAQVLETYNEPTQKTVIKSHSSGNAASNNLSSIPKTLASQTSPKQEQSSLFQQHPISNQRLPVSNFAQPQQIKQLTLNLHPDNNSSINKLNELDSNVIKSSNSPNLQTANIRKSKTLDEVTVPIILPTIPTSIIEKPSEKPMFAAPPAKRDIRISSTGSSTSKLKVVNQINSSNNNTSTCSSNKTQNLSRTKRAYSQSSHHETLQRISNIPKPANEWHAPDSYVFDSLGPFSTNTLREFGQLENFAKCDTFPLFNKIKSAADNSVLLQVQKHWLNIEDIKNSIPSWSQGREKRIELRKAQLRRQALQYYFARQFLSPTNARKRLVFVSKALKKLKSSRNECPPTRRCAISSCNNIALVLTSYCNLHITRNNDQHLFLPCTAKFSDNTQCRIPVFDITHNLPLCKEHAWKRDNYQRIIQEHKPRKAARKRTKSGALTKSFNNPLVNHKRNKRKRKPLLASDSGLGGMEISNNSADGIISSSSDVGSGSMEESGGGQNTKQVINSSNSITSFADCNVQSTKNNSDNHVVSELAQGAQVIKLLTNTKEGVTKVDKISDGNNDATQDSFNVCENSSAYESSEDTGFGALSDAELMANAHDVIEEIPLGEHDLTNVLNQLPVDAINEFFTTVQQNGPLEPTQEEQEYLERALEMANKQVQEQMNQMVGQQIEQMAVGGDQIDPNFLESFLVDNLDADICTEIVYSPGANEIDANSLLIDAESNGTIGSNSCNDNSTTAADIRNLVQT